VGALVKLMETPSTVGNVYNLGSDEEITINDLAKRVIALSGSKSSIEHIPYVKAYGQPFDDLPRRVPKLDKIKSAIGFSPKHSLDQIIRSVIEDQKRG
jgi:UDP-glucose 4-epimerase